MKTFYFAAAVPFLAALFSPIVAASPMPAGCVEAQNAAAAGDETALSNALKACAARGAAPGAAPPAPKGEAATGGSPAAAGGCYICGPPTPGYYEPGCHCENLVGR